MARRCVLVVDDDPAIRALVRARLGRKHDVLEAEHGDAALACLGAKAVDLVVTDFMMPGMTGGELCREIKERYGPSLPVVLVTASVPQDDAALVECGADERMAKPLDLARLMTTVERLLTR